MSAGKRSVQRADKALEACSTGAPNVEHHCPYNQPVRINSGQFFDAVAYATGRLVAEWKS